MEMCKRIGNKEFSKNGICVCAPYADLNPVSGKCEMSVTKLVTTTGECQALTVTCIKYVRVSVTKL